MKLYIQVGKSNLTEERGLAVTSTNREALEKTLPPGYKIIEVDVPEVIVFVDE